jgi:hypothetical protein
MPPSPLDNGRAAASYSLLSKTRSTMTSGWLPCRRQQRLVMYGWLPCGPTAHAGGQACRLPPHSARPKPGPNLAKNGSGRTRRSGCVAPLKRAQLTCRRMRSDARGPVASAHWRCPKGQLKGFAFSSSHNFTYYTCIIF